MIQNQQPGEETRTAITELQTEFGMISREEKIRMVSVTDDDLSRQQAFTLDIYNFHQCQYTALINLLIEANHARPVAETTSDHWR